MILFALTDATGRSSDTPRAIDRPEELAEDQAAADPARTIGDAGPTGLWSHCGNADIFLPLF
jgi:hypothetical protein